ncbi:12161_t:CDS:2 [Rhizophagus irregularis]|nr:12161_t:CDS:2 [Rhizophagus irregularis]
MLEEEDTNPFYDDTIMKYMSRPHLPEFETLTYPQYFEKYSITPSRPVASRRTVYQDDLRNYVVKRTKEIIVRYRFLKIEDGELYFYQQLLHNVPARNESDYKITPNGTYREKFLSLFPDFLNELQNNARTTQQLCITQLNTRFIEMLDRLLQSLHHELPATITQIIQIQMQNLKLLPPLLPETAMLELPRDQYRALSTINTFMGGNDGGFYTRSFTNTQLNARLKKVDTLIIEEISMVSAELFDFISNLFARIHNNALAFGGINVVVVGDLAQLPPVTGQPVFRSAVWTLFYPLFLTTPHRQHNDPLFYQILEEVQINNISSRTWNILTNRHSEFILQPSVDTLLNTTHIVGFKETAQKINISICNVLPVPPNNFLLSQSSDFVNSDQWDPSLSDHMFKSKTNLPSFVRLQPCARVMYLNNSLIEYGICNGTIGVVTDVNPTDQYARVAFSVRGSLIDIDIYRQNHYFNINGNNSRRTQFPLQNCFALTVHKTQGLTLQKVSLALDGGIFSPGQAYVALSRCTTWNNVSISHLDRSAFMVDPNVILEYQRLNTIATTNPHVFS